MPDTDKDERTLAPAGSAATMQDDDGALAAEEYERLLDMYDVSFKNLAEGEVVQRPGAEDHRKRGDRRHRLQVRGADPPRRVRRERQGRRQARRRGRGLLESRERRRLHRPLQGKSRQAQGLGRGGARLQGGREVIGRIIERVKGGLAVDIGVRAFLPGFQVDLRPVATSTPSWARAHMRVIKFNKKRGNIVLSRKAFLEEESDGKKARPSRPSRRARSSRAWSRTSPSTAPSSIWAASTACCTSPTCPGADQPPLRDVQGGRRDRVKVLKYNDETERVSLGLKQMSDDPWTTSRAATP